MSVNNWIASTKVFLLSGTTGLGLWVSKNWLLRRQPLLIPNASLATGLAITSAFQATRPFLPKLPNVPEKIIYFAMPAVVIYQSFKDEESWKTKLMSSIIFSVFQYGIGCYFIDFAPKLSKISEESRTSEISDKDKIEQSATQDELQAKESTKNILEEQKKLNEQETKETIILEEDHDLEEQAKRLEEEKKLQSSNSREKSSQSPVRNEDPISRLASTAIKDSTISGWGTPPRNNSKDYSSDEEK